MQELFRFALPIGLLAVLAVLILGVVNLVRTSGAARSTSNRLMRLRVVIQFVVVLLLVGALLAARYLRH